MSSGHENGGWMNDDQRDSLAPPKTLDAGYTPVPVSVAEEIAELYRGLVNYGDEPKPSDGFTGRCVECGKELHPDEYEAEVCDDCMAKLECE